MLTELIAELTRVRERLGPDASVAVSEKPHVAHDVVRVQTYTVAGSGRPTVWIEAYD